MEKKLGCIKSKLTGTERKFSIPKGSLDIPEEYSLKEYCTPIQDQGRTNQCVCFSTISALDWRVNMKTGKKTFNGFKPEEIYAIRSDKTQDNGMTFKESLSYAKNHGVKMSDGKNYKIDDFALVGSEIALKYALIENGICLFAVPVYDTNYTDFWKERGEIIGGHAMAIVGYNQFGYIFRNSWGDKWSDKGYGLLPYSDFKYVWEVWTLL